MKERKKYLEGKIFEVILAEIFKTEERCQFTDPGGFLNHHEYALKTDVQQRHLTANVNNYVSLQTKHDRTLR